MTNSRLELDLDIEKDVWVKMPPKREFRVMMNIVFRGHSKPDPLPDELERDVELETVTK